MDLLMAGARAETDSQIHRDILRGVQQALEGSRSVEMPLEWKDAYKVFAESKLAEVKQRSLALGAIFGDERALTSLRFLVGDSSTPVEQRKEALRTLSFKQPSDLLAILQNLLTDKSIRGAAIKGLAAFDDATTPGLILKQYPGFTSDEKADAVQTLASRPAYANALLDAIEGKTVARTDLSPFTVRQIQALKDAKINARLAEVWGTLRDPSKDKAAVIGKWKKALSKDVMASAKPQSGRVLYKTHCAACHKLFGDGAAIAPDLTGSQRFNLDYVLENIIDPSAVVPREYQVSIFTTTGGRVLTGIVKQETDRAVTVQTQNELVILPKDEIDSRVQSRVSMMPEGLFDRLSVEEVRDLVAYLASPAQVPLGK
jgi:putative heme-binding domain-containing protein